MSLLNLDEFGFMHMVMDGMINSCTIVIGIYPFPIHITPSILYISEKNIPTCWFLLYCPCFGYDLLHLLLHCVSTSPLWKSVADDYQNVSRQKMAIDWNLYLRCEQKIYDLCIAVKILKGFTFNTRPRLCLMENPSNHFVLIRWLNQLYTCGFTIVLLFLML